MFQMMLAIFLMQGVRNRAFFDQRAEKDTPGRLADEFPARSIFEGDGRAGGGGARGSTLGRSRVRGSISVCTGVFTAGRPNYAAGDGGCWDRSVGSGGCCGSVPAASRRSGTSVWLFAA